MAEVQYTNVPDVLKQNIQDEVRSVREQKCPTLDSFKNKPGQRVQVSQNGYQIPLMLTEYSQNSYLTPGPAGNSYQQPVAPTTKSMWVGIAYQAAVQFEDGFLLDSLSSKNSLMDATVLRQQRLLNFFKHQNYYAIGDGQGAVAMVTSVVAGTFTGTTAAQTTSGFTKGAHRLLANTLYDIVDESSFAVVGTITPTVNGTNSATVTVTSTGSPNNASAFVVEHGAYNKVPRGLASLINSTDRTFQGLDTTNHKELNSSVVDLNGSALTSAATNTLKTRVQIRTNVQSMSEEGMRICHTTPGLYNVLAIQGFSGRQYQAAGGQATTSYGYPEKYVENDNFIWALDADMDEDRVYLRTPGDYFLGESKPFGPVERDGMIKRQLPGLNNVGANSWYNQFSWDYNLGFSGQVSGGNTSSSFIKRAAVTAGTSQVTAIAG